jgi:hypothetical protein
LKNTDSPLQFRYLAEALSSLKPLNLSDEIINAYFEETSKDNKIALLKILGESLYPDDDMRSFSNNEMEAFIKKQQQVHKQLKEIMITESEPDIADAAFNQYASIAPADELFNTINQLRASGKKTNLPESEYSNALLPKVFSDQETQDNLLPQILSGNFRKGVDFYNNLYYWANETGRKNLSSQTVTLLREKSQQTLETFDSRKVTEDGSATSDFVNNLKLVVSLSLDEGESKEKAIVDYSIKHFIYDTNEPLKLVNTMALSDEKTTDYFRNRKKEIIPALQGALTNSKLTQYDKDLIQNAIDVLNEK